MTVCNLPFRDWLFAFVAAVPLAAHAQVSGTPKASATVPGVTTLDAAGGALKQGGSAPVDTNTVLGRKLSDQAADYTAARNHSIKCDGTTDDTAAINSLASVVGASGMVFPPGVCVFTSTLTLSTYDGSILGAGPYGTTRLYEGSSTTNDLVHLGFGAPVSIGPGKFGGFTIRSNTTMTGGAALRVELTGNINVEDVVVDGNNGKIWNGIWFDQFDHTNLNNYFAVAQNDALRVSAGGVVGGASAGPQFDLWATHGKLSGGVAGLHIGGGVDNVYFDSSIVTSSGTNVLIDHALSGVGNQELGFGPSFVTDQSVYNNYLINDTLANPTYYCTVSIAGPITHAKSGANGISVTNWPGCMVSVKSPYILANSGSGISILDNSAYVSVSPETIISTNGYGISAAFPNYIHLLSSGVLYGNTTADYNSNVVGVGLGNWPGRSVTAVSVSASPFAYTAPAQGVLAVSGGTVSTISITRQGSVVPSGITSGMVPVHAGDVVTITYSAAPMVNLVPE